MTMLVSAFFLGMFFGIVVTLTGCFIGCIIKDGQEGQVE